MLKRHIDDLLRFLTSLPFLLAVATLLMLVALLVGNSPGGI
jgi:hypothetical protein